jgi:shikimate kinase
MIVSGKTRATPIARNIALVGMMGVGKTSIGKRLSHRLNLPFADADHEIVAAAGMPIVEIFEKFGESHFRDGERRVIARLLQESPKVLATGGGAFMNAETRALLLEKAFVIWLDADIETLLARVTRKNDRPLLNAGDPAQTLRRLAEERNPVYAKAHLHVRSNVGPHDITVEHILKGLSCQNQ